MKLNNFVLCGLAMTVVSGGVYLYKNPETRKKVDHFMSEMIPVTQKDTTNQSAKIRLLEIDDECAGIMTAICPAPVIR